MTELKEENSIENIKESILIIEGMFHALNSPGVNFPLRVSEGVLKCMNMLGKMHENLLTQLGPDEVQKMRDQFKTPSQKKEETSNLVPA